MFLQLLALKKNQIKKNYHFIVCLGIRHQKGVEVGLKKSKLMYLGRKSDHLRIHGVHLKIPLETVRLHWSDKKNMKWDQLIRCC